MQLRAMYQVTLSYLPEITVSYDGGMMIEILAIVCRCMTTLIVMSMNDSCFFVFGIIANSCAGSADLPITRLRRCRRIVDEYIVNETATRLTMCSITRRFFYN